MLNAPWEPGQGGCAVNILMEPIYDLTNPDYFPNRETIIAAVLQDTQMEDAFTAEEATRVRVHYADLMGKGERDALVTVSFGPNVNIMAVYSQGEDGAYTYEGELGEFQGVDNIRIVRPPNSDFDLVLFRERSDQEVGGLERGGYFRGYEYKDGGFKNVISFDENIESWWNEGYRGGKHRWSRVMQTSKIGANEEYNLVTVEKTQAYSVAESTSGFNKPGERSFMEQERRIITENYYWDGNYDSYLLGEKVEKETGENVGILHDFGHSPYVLVGENFDMYRILRKDGTVDIVDYEALENIGG